MTVEPAQTIDDLTADWATRILRDTGTISDDVSVETASAEVVGTGQLGRVLRLDLGYDGAASGSEPDSVIVKLAAENETSRQTGIALGVYEVEVRFYEQVASTVDITTPRCHFAAVDPSTGWFTLVFDDLSRTAQAGDMVAGGTPEQASLALTELAKLQAPRWNDATLKELAWLVNPAPTQMLFGAFVGAAPKFLEDLGSQLTDDQAALIERTMPSALDWVNGWSGPFVVQHGDYRLDNMLFGRTDGAPALTVVDWQTARLGPPMVDAAFYLGGCLPRDVRSDVERELLQEYHGALQAAGVEGYSFDELWTDYRRYCLYGLFMAVGTYALVEQDDRGRALFAGAARQYADLSLDLEAAALLEA
jgi:hypothetical protein